MRGPHTTGGGAPHAPVTVLGVTGGADGISAERGRVLELAARLDRSGERLDSWAAHSRSVAADPDLMESGLLSPQTAARAEAAVLATLVALTADARWWTGTAAATRSAIDLLEVSDQAARALVDSVDHQLGWALGFSLLRLPSVTGWCVLGLATGGFSDRALTDHPTVFRHLMNGSGGLVGGVAAGVGLPFLPIPRVEDGARLAAAAYGDEGRPVVRRVGVGLVGDTQQPASVEDLIAHLQDVAGLSPGSHSALNGTIEVQSITGADGRVRHVVYLPGTDDLTTTPWSQDQDVRDMATNEQLMAGEQDTYQQGILRALHEAGVQPGDPVALVGHSQGGMEAAALLAHHAHGSLHITDVVTAGSPTDQVGGFPAGSHMLSLEQQGDIVPSLDGRGPQDSVQQTTVTFDAHPGGGVLDHHGYPAYVAGAAAADASTDPSVEASLASLRQGGFLGDGSGVQVTAQVFQITRG